MNTQGYIDITGIDLRKLVAAAFARSIPQGMGFLHHQPGPITDAEIDAGIENKGADYDYVRGRSMKLHIFADGDHLYWNRGWYDHSDSQQRDVLIEAGMSESDAGLAMEKAAAEQLAKYAEPSPQP